ncbi:hypothetical protein LCGC14_2914900 [marine sediment metagenome]|uniref:Uncharacterized protein n=1 Tax=marine sediment metagenome TaxID=412755 RepID=A0A0F8XQT1_9ZZZZ
MKKHTFNKGDLVRYISDNEVCKVVAIDNRRRAPIGVRTARFGVCFETPDRLELKRSITSNKMEDVIATAVDMIKGEVWENNDCL